MKAYFREEYSDLYGRENNINCIIICLRKILNLANLNFLAINLNIIRKQIFATSGIGEVISRLLDDILAVYKVDKIPIASLIQIKYKARHN